MKTYFSANLLLITILVSINSAFGLNCKSVKKILICKKVLKCRGSSSYGGPCYAGYGGPLYDGYGGNCYAGYGGALYDGYGGPLYHGYGGNCYDGYGGNCYAGYGGKCFDYETCPLECLTVCKGAEDPISDFIEKCN